MLAAANLSSRRVEWNSLTALDDPCAKPREAMVACDFAVAVTLHFQILYVFLVMEVVVGNSWM